MKFVRSKKLVFCNNKGGVGKTTLAYNTAVCFAKSGYKTVLVDLDPQCNLTLLSLGKDFFEQNLFTHLQKDIYDVVKGIVEGGGDVDFSIGLVKTNQDNLYIVPGSLRLSLFEELLVNSSFNLTASGQRRGFVDTSAIDRYLQEKGLKEEVDVFVIDTSPNLGMLNRIVLLGSDYFIVPVMPDIFSLQGIENLGMIFSKWKDLWKNTAKALSGDIESKYILSGEGLFIGYVINSFSVYGGKMANRHEEWSQMIPPKVKEYLSERHCKNGLVEKSWKEPLCKMQDYGHLPAISMINSTAIFDLTTSQASELNFPGTKEVYLKAKDQFAQLSKNILEVLHQY